MPVLPIQYAQTTPGAQAPGVPGQLDFDDGSQAVWESIARLGAAVSDTTLDLAAKIEAAEASTELDSLRRQEAQAWTTYLEQSAASRDPVEINALYKAYEGAVEGLSSKRPGVQQAFGSHMAERLPARRLANVQREREVRLAILQEKMKVNQQWQLAQADKAGYARDLDKAVALGTMLPETRDRMIGQFDADSALERMRVATARGDLNGAAALAGEMEKMELTSDQLRYRGELADTVKRQRTANATAQREAIAAEQDAFAQGEHLDAEWLAKRDELAAAIRASTDLDPTDKTLLLAKNEKWYRGTASLDPQLMSGLWQRISNTNTFHTPDPTLRAEIMEAFVGLRGPAAAAQKKTMLAALGNAQATNLFQATESVRQDFKARLRGSPQAGSRQYLLEQHIWDYIGSHPDATPADVYRVAREGSALYGRETVERPEWWKPWNIEQTGGMTSEQIEQARRRQGQPEIVVNVEEFLRTGGKSGLTMPDDDRRPVRIETDEQYDALDAGTPFIGPDGVQRRKP